MSFKRKYVYLMKSKSDKELLERIKILETVKKENLKKKR